MAVFGRNKVEPPCGGFFQRLVYFEVARFGVRHIARAGVMGRPGAGVTEGVTSSPAWST
jgi:hypothetical protein